MIDIHCHILPCVDDGSSSLEISRKLLIDAKNEGIDKIVVTPHFSRFGKYKTKKEELLILFNKFKEDTFDIGVDLFLGNELYIDEDLDTLLSNNEVCSLNDGKYVLVEFPFDFYKDEFDEYLYNISLDYKIIIAHPERYSYVLKDHNFVYRWVNRGYLLQCNQNSLFIWKNRRVVYDLIKKGFVSFICSDGHDLDRPLSLIDAYRFVENKFSSEVANLLFFENGRRVIENIDVLSVPLCKKKFF